MRPLQWKQQDYSAKVPADKDELDTWIKPLAYACVDLDSSSFESTGVKGVDALVDTQ
ncbi:MAG: hypothetical protein HRU20_00315 [Pseudomonadales bacterium]|nr:hypothetical protein [Pseudomonadales bacterium]